MITLNLQTIEKYDYVLILPNSNNIYGTKEDIMKL